MLTNNNHCLAIAVFIPMFCIGCQSTYLIHRSNDALDIATIGFERSPLHISMQVGPFTVGLTNWREVRDANGYGLICGRLHLYRCMQETLLISDKKHIAMYDADIRNKTYFYKSIFPIPYLSPVSEALPVPIECYSQCEFALGAYYGIRIGINPGEFLDLLFGFTTFDIYKDDIIRDEPEPKKPLDKQTNIP